MPEHLTLLTVERGPRRNYSVGSVLALEFDEELFRAIRGLEERDGYPVPKLYPRGKRNLQRRPGGGPLKRVPKSWLIEMRSVPEATATGPIRNRAAWKYLGGLDTGAEVALYWRP